MTTFVSTSKFAAAVGFGWRGPPSQHLSNKGNASCPISMSKYLWRNVLIIHFQHRKLTTDNPRRLSNWICTRFLWFSHFYWKVLVGPIFGLSCQSQGDHNQCYKCKNVFSPFLYGFSCEMDFSHRKSLNLTKLPQGGIQRLSQDWREWRAIYLAWKTIWNNTFQSIHIIYVLYVWTFRLLSVHEMDNTVKMNIGELQNNI